MPKVSVIIPVYNVEAYLRQCLDSVVKQTLRDIEIICVDDGSTDGSAAILAEYAARDSRVKVLLQGNAGAGVARNTGLAVARGEYICFCDPDDFLPHDLIECVYKVATANKVDITIYGVDSYDASGTKISRCQRFGNAVGHLPKVFSAKDISERLFGTFLPCVWNKLFRREFIAHHKIEFQALPRANDIFFSMMHMALAERIIVTDKVAYCYRRGRDGSAQNLTEKDPLPVLSAYRKVKESLIEKSLFDQYLVTFNLALFSSFFYTLNLLQSKASKQKLFEELKNGIFKGLLSETLTLCDFSGRVSDYLIYRNFMLCSTFESFEMANVSGSRAWNEMPPVVSVIVPCYNVEPFLAECLDSVLAQTFGHYEVICVNDGSTDGTGEILAKYQLKDSRIIVINQESKGLSVSRNVGIDVARGEYILFLDSDDKLHVEALKELVGLAEIDKLDHIAFCAEVFVDEGSRPNGDIVARYKRYYASVGCSKFLCPQQGCDLALSLLEKANFIESATLRLMRLSVLRDHRVRFTPNIIHEDCEFTPKALVAARCAIFIPQKYYQRRIRSNSIMMSTDRRLKSAIGYSHAALSLMDAILFDDMNVASRQAYEEFVAQKMMPNSVRFLLSLTKEEKDSFLVELEKLVPSRQMVIVRVVILSLLNEVIAHRDCAKVGFLVKMCEKIIAFLPFRFQRLKDGLQCLKDRGLEYTVWRIDKEIKSMNPKSCIRRFLVWLVLKVWQFVMWIVKKSRVLCGMR